MRKVVLVVLLTTALVAAGCGGDDDDADVDTGSGGDSSAKTVELEADNFYFEPEAIDAKAGDTLTIEVENEGDAPHTFTVDALDIDQEIAPGESAEIEVTVPDSGGVDFYCRFHEGRGMKGTIGAGGGADTGDTGDTDDDGGGGSGSDDGY
jgi:plastocyanin